jgi:ferric-dicitrate binding protein FerR (iron transport regulator)
MPVRQAPAPAADIMPGGNKAILTLGDNTTINLDDAKNGVVGQQGNTQVVKSKEGRLDYYTVGAKASAITYNLLTTPRGGQYQLALPDGSKVWLNAASSLRYPTAFAGKERVVELHGEAYFEIAPNPSMPFKVAVSQQAGEAPAEIEVLGTHFNVKAYADEPAVHTTLLEGSVRVRKGRNIVPLQPGQQASWNSARDVRVVPADVEEAVAWKNGLFKFNEATIEDVMRQLSRWYDVEVVYTNGIPGDLFRGEIYRNVNVSKVLKVLEASGVQFKVEGKKILVQ